MSTNNEQVVVEFVENAKNDNKESQPDDDNTVELTLKSTKFNEFLSNYDEDSINSAITDYIKSRHKDLYPSPFLDNLFPRDWHSQAVPPDDPNLNFKARIRRSMFVIVTPLLFIGLCTATKIHFDVIIGLSLLAMFTIYFCQVFYYVFCAKSEDGERKLYRVYSISDVPDKWTNLKTGYVQLLYRDESIQSISELSAINGGVTKTMLNTLGAYTWCAMLCHYTVQLYLNRDRLEWDRADICELVGVIGLLLISIFELDPFSKPMQYAHYTGAALGTGTIAGLVLQQSTVNGGDKLWFAITVAVIAGIFFSLWMIVGIATDLAQIKSKARYMPEYLERIKEAEDKGEEVKISWAQCFVCKCFKNKDVNTYSKLNIVFEGIFLYLGAASLCTFLMEYSLQVCDYGCATKP